MTSPRGPVGPVGLLVLLGLTSTCAFSPPPRQSSPCQRRKFDLRLSDIIEAESIIGQTATTTTQRPDVTQPLSPLTFAGQVERALLSKFEEDKIERVIASWRLLEKDYDHREFVGPQQSPPILDSEESRCWQHAPSFVPGLKALQWWDNVDDIGWAQSLKNSFEDIRDEFVEMMENPKRLQSEGNNIWAGALSTDAESYGEGWKTLVLLNRGQWDETNAKLFPRTSKAIQKCGVPAVEAFFASMKPNTSIKPHSDFTNFVLTSHLPLVVPENGNNKCRLSVGDESRQWMEGKVILFDTSILHDAINEADEMRYILMLRVWHPDLSGEEREALQFIYDVLELPELLSDDAGTRFMAEERARMAKEFPLKATGGFGASKSKRKKVKGKKRSRK